MGRININMNYEKLSCGNLNSIPYYILYVDIKLVIHKKETIKHNKMSLNLNEIIIETFG